MHNSAPTGAGLTHPLTSVVYMGGDTAKVGPLTHAYKTQPVQLYDVWNKFAGKGRDIYEKLKLKASTSFMLNSPTSDTE